MTCREFCEHLPDHLDGTLPGRQERAVRRHAAHCRPCAAYATQYRATVDAIRAFTEWDDLDAEEELDLTVLTAGSSTAGVH